MYKAFFFLIFLGATSICVNADYFIEINPNNGPNPYVMKTGDAVTFEVNAYKKQGEAVSSIDLKQKIWWQYDKMLLEKISSEDNSIKLKAVKEGAAELSATTVIRNNSCQKKINIYVTK